MKPKVLFFLQLPPPIHGASVVNQSIKDSSLINSKIDARYINISPAKEISDLGKLSLKKIWLTFSIFVKAILEYFRFKPDLVYLTLTPHGAAFWKDAFILLVVKTFGANVTVHMHGKGIAVEVKRSKVLCRIYQFVFRNVNVIHLSESLFPDVETVFDKKMKFLVVNNGVQAFDVKRRIREDIVTFVYLSNFVPTKGSDTLVAAINCLEDKYKGKFRVKLIGKVSEVEYYDNLLKSVDNRFKDDVDFLGPLYGNSKVEALSSSDVFVLPTRYKNECFPLSILEAMNFGLPVLSTYEGAIPDIVDDGLTGFLFDASCPIQLSKLMASYIDAPNLIEEQGRRSFLKFEEKYRLESFESNFVESILSLSIR